MRPTKCDHIKWLIILAVFTLRASTVVLLSHRTKLPCIDHLPCIHHLHCVSLPEEHFLNRRVTWNAFRVHWYHYVDGKPKNSFFCFFLNCFFKKAGKPCSIEMNKFLRLVYSTNGSRLD